MPKQNSNPESLRLVSEDWEDHPITLWIGKHGKTIGWAALFLFALGLLLYRYNASEKTQAINDYVQAETSATALVEGKASDEQLLSLENIVKARPKLQSKYDGLLAQSWMIRNEPAKAAPYLDRSLKRTASDGAKEFDNYAKTSLTIENKDYAKALTEALALKTDSPTLNAFNKLRIINLQFLAGQNKEAKENWSKFVELAKNDLAAAEIIQVYEASGIPLSKFVQMKY